MSLTDDAAAAQAIHALDALTPDQRAAQADLARILHADTPFVDVHELFALVDTLYFRATLRARVEVSWSSRLTLCAGICELVKNAQGKYTRIRLKLSEPLLKFRPRSDTVNTLLHEAIHAYFFVTSFWHHSRDDKSGHGAAFQMLASAINGHGGFDVTVFHAFHDEVDSYRTHVWLCDGPCRASPPYFGLVKRSMNRAPGKSDSWWSQHQQDCGGAFTKIAEPDLTKKQIDALSVKERAGRQKNKIDRWIKVAPSSIGSTQGEPPSTHVNPTARDSSAKRERSDEESIPTPQQKKTLLACPICDVPVTEDTVNDHLDSVHGTG
ncbi:putative zinc finger rad18 domain-containing protein [Lasiodiplodia theobromae]|uniref:SprT-like domain-containing protein Spartan n=1 Tax=Lasiodiplodia theobromae TaxID=45133 RepID=A0A5N5DJF8_9PEZI|nr:Sprt-like domain-containing protein spartan [Lasiodiplodia theobromae]KAB2577461.1 SprT-like domain-containing protein Spartan [Lasiodiplodia theobromae]KAF4535846.1 Sprt-like domain-containing protein spartan [Lasiodiplodia theobromae]KAF9640440.1 putative zinc finger rad18 domain-containing protein [Lasiodiplodia theobromae]